MDRIPPGERLRQRIDELLQGGWQGEEDLSTVLLRLGAQRLAQELLEQEVADFLGRARYERVKAGQDLRGYRNGYRPAHIRSAEGEIELEVPRVRQSSEPHSSRLMAFLRGNSDVLERLVVEMYARGLSTRDIEDALYEATGDRLLTRSAVSELTDVLWAEYEAFSQRDLSGFPVEYLFLDAVYESLRRLGAGPEGVLCAWAICSDGRKVLLHLALGSRESYLAWRDFLRDLVRRGLNTPLLIATDGAPGLIKAVEEMWPMSLRQRCLAHKMRNVLAKVPLSARDELKAAIRAVYYAPNREVAEMLAKVVLERYQGPYPSAMRSLREDLEACWAYLCCPTVHHKRIRTTNLLERSFVEERRRTKVIPRFFTEKSCLKLVFATLWRASQRWQGVRMSDIEVQQLRALRQELGLLKDEGQPNRENREEELVASA